MFHIVGKNNGISGGVAKNIFYYAKATYAEKDKAIDDVLKSRVFRLREDQDYKDFVQKISKTHEI